MVAGDGLEVQEPTFCEMGDHFLSQEKAREHESSLSKKRKCELSTTRPGQTTVEEQGQFGVVFPRWKSVMRDKGFQSDAEVRCFLLGR